MIGSVREITFKNWSFDEIEYTKTVENFPELNNVNSQIEIIFQIPYNDLKYTYSKRIPVRCQNTVDKKKILKAFKDRREKSRMYECRIS